MASAANGGAEDATQLTAELGKTLKEGERIVGPTRRPDGTLRKPIRIRAGYVPQDEVAIYQSRGALWKKEMAATEEVPPGYDPVVETKPKSKAAKRNERKKEKRLQAALDKDTKSEQNYVVPCGNLQENVESVASKMNGLSLSGSASMVTPPDSSFECASPMEQVQDIDKKIRALKKKIRLTEAQHQKTSEKDLKTEQLEKVAKLEGWRNELKLLGDKKAELTTSLS
ncbi:partner of y14 and mago [Phtheirospermum japonicum]|uniref:Partner of y14 and mago n=1 Tax=Phtheirospermum japonicum TaxID=374723 RepID=A0A830CC13_9LAMI|nr:partner of y14 and mago [Phtheirospermum japonicum]